MEFVTEPAKKTPVVNKADVVVVGGGPAGFGAAICAARNGMDTIVIERFGSLGGTNNTGLMPITMGEEALTGVAGKIIDRLRLGGYAINIVEKYPDIISNPLTHFYSGAAHGRTIKELMAWDPHMSACVMNEMLEELSVRLMLCCLFVDIEVEDGVIKAVIVENASGRQAIEGKVFIDATGRGDVVARSGAPYKSAANELGFPMPPGLMWKMSGVDCDRLFEYQKKDPRLEEIMEKAKAKGQLPPIYRPKKTEKEMKFDDRKYTGHPYPEFEPLGYPGETLHWTPSIHEWGLNCAEKAEDLTRAHIDSRKQIVSELNFLKNYVPGFEKAHLGGIAAMMGIREGRHPIGEYVLTYEDIRKFRKFDDVALRPTTIYAVDTDQGFRRLQFEIPYRCFLAKKIENLLLAGDNTSVEHAAFIHYRSFGPAMRLGEVAGTAAALSVKNKTRIKELKWPSPL